MSADTQRVWAMHRPRAFCKRCGEIPFEYVDGPPGDRFHVKTVRCDRYPHPDYHNATIIPNPHAKDPKQCAS